MVHYGGHGTIAATMVHCVLSIDVCYVHDLFVTLKIGNFPIFVASSLDNICAWPPAPQAAWNHQV